MCRSVVALLLLTSSLGIFLPASGVALLSPEEKLRYSTHVFIGFIQNVVSRTVADARYSNYENIHFQYLVKIERVVKSVCRGDEAARCTLAKPKEDVLVYGWIASKRPDGFTGARGMVDSPVEPAVGQRYSFAVHFLHREEIRRGMYQLSFPASEGVVSASLAEYNLVMPNGLDDPALFPEETDEL